jgi:hypothetical protein
VLKVESSAGEAVKDMPFEENDRAPARQKSECARFDTQDGSKRWCIDAQNGKGVCEAVAAQRRSRAVELHGAPPLG